jgi:hypothetical protein
MDKEQIKPTDILSRDLFKTWKDDQDDTLIGLKISDGSIITVLDRMNGFIGGIRDVESGYRDADGKFWLASGNFDITKQGAISISDAIMTIKLNANTCIGA